MAESTAYFAVKSISLSRAKDSKPCTLLEAARHNLREIQAEQGATGHIDPRRTHLNSVLHGPASAVEVQAHAGSLLVNAGINAGKLRRDHCQAIEVVFSLPQDNAIHDSAAYYVQCLAWLTDASSLPVLSAVIHYDESAIHLHVLLLPLKNGAHVGGAPIARAALRSLRENFFAKVAGPAGLKRAGAKVRGVVKQWAVAAVLQRCEGMSLPAANGPLWPILVDAIKRDPTPMMIALGIDVNTIRPTDEVTPNELPQNPIGIASNPIGFQKEGAKHRTLSCVGFANSTTSKQQPQAINSLNDLWAVAGQSSQWKAPRPCRLGIARAAEQSALARHANKSRRPAPAPTIRIDEDGLTRERDEYVHDLSAWD